MVLVKFIMILWNALKYVLLVMDKDKSKKQAVSLHSQEEESVQIVVVKNFKELLMTNIVCVVDIRGGVIDNFKFYKFLL